MMAKRKQAKHKYFACKKTFLGLNGNDERWNGTYTRIGAAGMKRRKRSSGVSGNVDGFCFGEERGGVVDGFTAKNDAEWMDGFHFPFVFTKRRSGKE